MDWLYTKWFDYTPSSIQINIYIICDNSLNIYVICDHSLNIYVICDHSLDQIWIIEIINIYYFFFDLNTNSINGLSYCW